LRDSSASVARGVIRASELLFHSLEHLVFVKSVDSSLLLLGLSAPRWLGVLVSAQPHCELHKNFVLAILSEDFIVSDLGLERRSRPWGGA
jgi:hypothetical protein